MCGAYLTITQKQGTLRLAGAGCTGKAQLELCHGALSFPDLNCHTDYLHSSIPLSEHDRHKGYLHARGIFCGQSCIGTIIFRRGVRAIIDQAAEIHHFANADANDASPKGKLTMIRQRTCLCMTKESWLKTVIPPCRNTKF